MRVLIAGVSTRAAAASAARAGFDVTTIDAFGDLDQPASAAVRVVRPFTAHAAARAARDLRCDAVMYLSSFENRPRAVARLAAGRTLWGNPPDVLARVRNPEIVARELRARGIRTPELCLTGMPARELPWLIKPRASGGGHRVRSWSPGERLRRDENLQERIAGTPGSVVFIARAGRAIPLGVTRQLVGDPAFGASGYRYCGSILCPDVTGAAARLAQEATAAFGLAGANGIDFVEQEGVPIPIEINPRWSASMELVERAHGIPVFAAHAGSFLGAGPKPGPYKSNKEIVGKAIIYARDDVVMGDTRAWLGDDSIADIPHPGERIAAGRPVCTVFAEGADESACYAALVRRADDIYMALSRWVEAFA